MRVVVFVPSRRRWTPRLVDQACARQHPPTQVAECLRAQRSSLDGLVETWSRRTVLCTVFGTRHMTVKALLDVKTKWL